MGVFLHEQICSIFNLLDMIGYWKDKETTKSNMARVYDASHTYLASGCDFFVTNDNRCSKKAKVAYFLKNVKTEIINWKIKSDKR